MTSTLTPTLTYTPSPTLVPWATPTPFPEATAGFTIPDGLDTYVEVAEYAVNIWQTMNRNGDVDLVITFILIVMLLYGLRTIKRRLESL